MFQKIKKMKDRLMPGSLKDNETVEKYVGIYLIMAVDGAFGGDERVHNTCEYIKRKALNDEMDEARSKAEDLKAYVLHKVNNQPSWKARVKNAAGSMRKRLLGLKDVFSSDDPDEVVATVKDKMKDDGEQQ